MRVVIVGGGTGGHIYPAIAIADRIKKRSNDAEILFIGTERGLEREIVPKHNYPIEFITATGLNRRNLIANVKVLKDYVKGKKQAKKILENFKPDIVIGTGGYVCGSVIKVASAMGIKCYIHEQNATPGITNKLLEKCVKNVFLGFEEASDMFKDKSKHIFSGNPVRDEFFKMKKDEARKLLGLSDEFAFLVFGGSQGAGKINMAVMKLIANIKADENIKIIFATGKKYYEPIIQELEEQGIKISSNIEILPYIDDMPKYISGVDLVISRSGALSVSEVAVCGTPAIFIPSPNVAGNHQMFNAKAIADKGGAIIIEENNLDESILEKEMFRLKDDRELLEDMAVKVKKCAPLDASDIIYYNIING